jgi:hypothetical protein
MSTAWPQVPAYTGSRRHTPRARWPAGVSLACLSAAALLAACGGSDCADDEFFDTASGECVAHRDVGPVNCRLYPEQCL